MTRLFYDNIPSPQSELAKRRKFDRSSSRRRSSPGRRYLPLATSSRYRSSSVMARRRSNSARSRSLLSRPLAHSRERSCWEEMRFVEQIASGGWRLVLSLCVQAEYGFSSLALNAVYHAHGFGVVGSYPPLGGKHVISLVAEFHQHHRTGTGRDGMGRPGREQFSHVHSCLK